MDRRTPAALAATTALLVACGGGDDGGFYYSDVAWVAGHDYAIYLADTGRDCGDFASESALFLVGLAAPGRVERLPYDSCKDTGRWAVSPDGRVVVYATDAGHAYIVDLANDAVVTTGVLRPTGYPWVFSPDGSGLYFVDDDGDLRRFSIATRSAGPALNPPGTETRHFELSADGRYLVHGSWAEQVVVIDLQDGNATAPVLSPGGYEAPETMGFTADGTRLVYMDCVVPLRCQWTIGSTDAYYTALLADPSQVTRLSGALPPGTTFDWPNFEWPASSDHSPRGELSEDRSLLGYRLETGPLAIDRYAASDLAFVDLATPGVHTVAPKGAHTHGAHYALSADGEFGVYRVDTRAADGETVLDSALWRFARDDIANATELVHGFATGDYAFSHDSAQVAFVLHDELDLADPFPRQLWIAPTDGSAAPTLLFQNGGDGGPGNVWEPRFTRDDAGLVFVSSCCSWSDGSSGDGLWRVPVAGGEPQRLSAADGQMPYTYRLFRAL